MVMNNQRRAPFVAGTVGYLKFRFFNSEVLKSSWIKTTYKSVKRHEMSANVC